MLVITCVVKGVLQLGNNGVHQLCVELDVGQHLRGEGLSQQPGCLQAAPGLRKIHSHRSRGGGYIVSKEMVLPRVHRIKRTFLSLVWKVDKLPISLLVTRLKNRNSSISTMI
jgi:hypothetical protein